MNRREFLGHTVAAGSAAWTGEPVHGLANGASDGSGASVRSTADTGSNSLTSTSGSISTTESRVRDEERGSGPGGGGQVGELGADLHETPWLVRSGHGTTSGSAVGRAVPAAHLASLELPRPRRLITRP